MDFNPIYFFDFKQVDKEDHELLQWDFNHREIPGIIDRQTRGETLNVQDIGDFSIEWHLLVDLKTLKCMYNISKGANSKTPCLYCMDPASVYV